MDGDCLTDHRAELPNGDSGGNGDLSRCIADLHAIDHVNAVIDVYLVAFCHAIPSGYVSIFGCTVSIDANTQYGAAQLRTGSALNPRPRRPDEVRVFSGNIITTNSANIAFNSSPIPMSAS